MKMNWYEVTFAFDGGGGQVDTMLAVSSIDAVISAAECFKASADNRKVLAVGVKPCAAPADFPYGEG